MAARTSAGVTYFASADAFGSWLAKNHQRVRELVVGFYKTASGRGGLTYREALDLALAYGWIDGVRKSVDAASYTIRFSPRRADSIWSAVNRRRVEELIAAGAMQAPGPCRISKPRSEEDRPLLLRTAADHLRTGRRKDVPGEPPGLGVLRGAATRLSPHRDLVCGQRREGRDPPAAARDVDSTRR